MARCLASHSDTSSELRRTFASKKGFRAFPSIIGKDIPFVLLKPVGGGKIITLRSAKVGKKWYQSRQSDDSTPAGWLPKYPPYEAYVLGHPALSIMIKSAGK